MELWERCTGGAGAGAAGSEDSACRLPGRFSAKMRSTTSFADGVSADAVETIPTGATMPSRQAVINLLNRDLQVEETAQMLLSLV
jgi:hypothetical protein